MFIVLDMLIYLGIKRMKGEHKAENLLLAIEEIVNSYDFDKSKITSIVTDEGSNYVRLFKAEDEEPLFIEDEEISEYKDDDRSESSDDDNEIDSDDDNENNAEIDLNSIVEKENIITIAKVKEEINMENRLISEIMWANELEMKNESINDLNQLEIDTQSSLSINQSQNNQKNFDDVNINNTDNNEDDDDKDEYMDNFTSKRFLNELHISIGENKIARYSCAAHKVNLAVRKAIKQHEPIKTLLKSLSKYAKKTKLSIS